MGRAIKNALNQSNPKEIFDFTLETVQPELDVKTDAITKEKSKKLLKA